MIGFFSCLISGIISGVIASIILNIYYWNQKPKLEISSQIAINENDEYHIKIINKSHFYITNISIHLRLVTLTNGNGGIIENEHDLEFPTNKILTINPYNKKDKYASFALRLGISYNLEEIWKEDEYTYLKFMIYCSNEHNNASKFFEQRYYKKKQCLKHGNFKFGNSLEIENIID